MPLEMYVNGANVSIKQRLSKLEEKYQSSEEVPIVKS
jgi:hypothetical protein